MKRFLLVVMLFASAASLYAAELKVSGDMEVRGLMDNITPDGGDANTYNYFDYDLTINAALVANENATVFTRFAFDKTVDAKGTVADSTASAGDVNLALERAYINYKFMPALQVNAGLMGGGQWASAFGNSEINVMRVQLIGALSEQMIFILTYEKNDENGLEAADPADNEKFEAQTYYASAKLGFGGITVLPLVKYAQIGPVDEKATAMGLTLGVNGDFGMIGLESEFAYGSIDLKVADKMSGYSAYVNVFAKITETAKAGVSAIYLSADEETGFAMSTGGDFDWTVVMDDVLCDEAAMLDDFEAAAYDGYYAAAFAGAFAPTVPAGNAAAADAFALAASAEARAAKDLVYNGGIEGMMGAKIYGEATVIEKLTLGAAFAYAMSSNDDYSKLSFYEIDAQATYAFDANASYTIAGGYANIMNDGEAYASAYRVYHKFAVKF